MTSSLTEAALSYACRGWKILPLHSIGPNGVCTCGRSDCQSPGKHPRLPGGLKTASSDSATVRAWWTRWPTANIGCVCGPESFTVVDVDPRHGGDTSLRTLVDANDELPPTLAQQTGGGGWHYFFKHNPDCPCSSGTLGPGLDTRSQGKGYVLLPPSKHASGDVYRWINRLPIASMPDWLLPHKHTQPAPTPEPARRLPAPVHAPTSQQPDIDARAIAYIDSIPPAVQGHGGHAALLWASRCLVVGFCLPPAVAERILWDHYNPRCVPPWDPASPAQVKEFRRKISEAMTTASEKPIGWLLEEPETASEDVAVGATVADSLLNVPPEVVEGGSVEAPESPAITWPANVLTPPGLVGDIATWINSTAGCPQPLLSLGAALTMCGALFGRKVRDHSDGRTNLYAIGVAHSSSGKDHPSDCVARLLAAAGGADLLGGQVTSDSAIELSLMSSPSRLYLWDEIGHIFANIRSAANGGSPHLRTIVPTLMQLYSSAHKLYVGKQRAEGTARRIDQPNACIWGLTSPDVLYSSLSSAELRDGWLGRVLTFISEDRPRYNPSIRSAPPPGSIVGRVAAWLSYTPPPLPASKSGDILSATTHAPLLVETSPEALEVFETFRDEAYDKMIEADKAGDDCQFLWGKALQNARRIALILAAGCFDPTNPEQPPVISAELADIACIIARMSVVTLGDAVRNNVADTEAESVKIRVMKVIRSAGSKGINRTQFIRTTRFLRDCRTREDILSELIDSGQVVQRTNMKNSRGRHETFYVSVFKHARN